MFEQLADPAALIGELFSDPSQTLEALGQLGADMTEEERETSQDVVVAAVVASQVATMAAVAAIPPSAPSAPSGSGPSGSGPSGKGSDPQRRNEFDAGSGGEARRKPKVNASCVTITRPSDANRLQYYEEVIGGDSGNPVFTIINNEAVLLGGWYMKWPNAGVATLLPSYISDINSTIAALSSGYKITEADLSSYKTY